MKLIVHIKLVTANSKRALFRVIITMYFVCAIGLFYQNTNKIVELDFEKNYILRFDIMTQKLNDNHLK